MRGRQLKRASSLSALVVTAMVLSACSTPVVDESTFFADPAAYSLYDCKQLAAVRKFQSDRIEELRGLMAKADTGPGGSVIAEVAYRPDFVSAQAKLKLVEAEWNRNRCASEPASADPSLARPSPGVDPTAGRSRSRVY